MAAEYQLSIMFTTLKMQCHNVKKDQLLLHNQYCTSELLQQSATLKANSKDTSKSTFSKHPMNIDPPVTPMEHALSNVNIYIYIYFYINITLFETKGSATDSFTCWQLDSTTVTALA